MTTGDPHLLVNIRKKHEALAGKKAQYDGSRSQVRDHFNSRKRELDVPDFNGIDVNFRKLMYESVVVEKAQADLDKYHTALDKALMKFHTMKMAEFNHIIQELWQNTYKGNDIDTVAITSNVEADDKDDGDAPAPKPRGRGRGRGRGAAAADDDDDAPGPSAPAATGRNLRNYNYRV